MTIRHISNRLMLLMTAVIIAAPLLVNLILILVKG